jgi:hypothetical protein
MAEREQAPYDIVRRLAALRDLLTQGGSHTFGDIAAAMPGDYADTETARRGFRRDLKALSALGFRVSRLRHDGTAHYWLLSGDAPAVELTQDEFGALIGVSRSRVSQLICEGRVAPPLTVDKARRLTPRKKRLGGYRPPLHQNAVLAAMDGEWRTTIDIATRAAFDAERAWFYLNQLRKKRKIESRREASRANEWRLASLD